MDKAKLIQRREALKSLKETAEQMLPESDSKFVFLVRASARLQELNHVIRES